MSFDILSKKKISKRAARGGRVRRSNLQSYAGAPRTSTSALDFNQPTIKTRVSRPGAHRGSARPIKQRREQSQNSPSGLLVAAKTLRAQRLARAENRAFRHSPLGFFEPPTHLVGAKSKSSRMATLI